MGTAEFNKQLSELRAANTVTAFRDVLGPRLDQWEITHKGLGESEAAAAGEDEVRSAQHRQVDVVINQSLRLILATE